MRVFLVCALLLGLVFNLSIAAARQIGRDQPPTSPLYHLRFSECQPPCWIGILPGQTTLDDAMRHLQTAFAVPEEQFPRNPRAMQLFMALRLPDFNDPRYGVPMGMQLDVQLTEQVINEVRWIFPDQVRGGFSPVSVGDVVGLFGEPTCVLISNVPFVGWFFLWNAPDGVIEANMVAGDKLGWTQLVDTLNIHAHPPDSAGDACQSETSTYYPWSGLLSRQEYRRRYAR